MRMCRNCWLYYFQMYRGRDTIRRFSIAKRKLVGCIFQNAIKEVTKGPVLEVKLIIKPNERRITTPYCCCIRVHFGYNVEI